MNDVTVYADDPAAQARDFIAQGADWLHVVDLNGAFAGRAVNHDAVSAILNEANVPVQLGGGIRTMVGVASWLEAGVQRVVLGSAAVTHPEFVREACREFPGKIAVGIDARDGWVAIDGWARASTIRAAELALQVEQSGVSAIVYTDINRDGTLTGPNIEETLDLAGRLSTPVIVSGGVGSMMDLAALQLAAAKQAGEIDGVIIGRALYDGRIDLTVARRLLSC